MTDTDSDTTLDVAKTGTIDVVTAGNAVRVSFWITLATVVALLIK